MRLGVRAAVFVTVVSVAGLAILAVSAPMVPIRDWQGILLLAAVCGMAQLLPVSLFRSSSVSVSAGVAFAGLLLYGPYAAIWVNMGSALVAAFRPARKPFHKAAFNVGSHALAAGVAGAVYVAAGGVTRPGGLAITLVPILLAAIAYFIVQTGLISGIIALAEGAPLLQTWDANFRGTVLNFVALALISTSIASAEMSIGPIGIAVFSLPLAMVWYGFKYVRSQAGPTTLRDGQPATPAGKG